MQRSRRQADRLARTFLCCGLMAQRVPFIVARTRPELTPWSRGDKRVHLHLYSSLRKRTAADIRSERICVLGGPRKRPQGRATLKSLFKMAAPMTHSLLKLPMSFRHKSVPVIQAIRNTGTSTTERDCKRTQRRASPPRGSNWHRFFVELIARVP